MNERSHVKPVQILVGATMFARPSRWRTYIRGVEMIKVAVAIGETFTDLVLEDDAGHMRTSMVLKPAWTPCMSCQDPISDGSPA